MTTALRRIEPATTAGLDGVIALPRTPTASTGPVHYVLAHGLPPADQLSLLAGLPRNWDGQDAEPITDETIFHARRLLSLLPRGLDAPDIAPASDGSIGFEWQSERGFNAKVFLDVGPGATLSAYVRRASGRTRTWPARPFGINAYLALAEIFGSSAEG